MTSLLLLLGAEMLAILLVAANMSRAQTSMGRLNVCWRHTLLLLPHDQLTAKNLYTLVNILRSVILAIFYF